MANEIKELKERVFRANMDLPAYGLIKFTWGNASEIDRASGLIAIKPSGVSYDNLKLEDMVVLSLNGDIVEGNLRPSSDTPTHLELYRAFPDIGGVVHTHSAWATSWAQAGLAIPCYGTTHADYFYGTVPCTRQLTEEEVKNEYELNTGKVIVETMQAEHHVPLEMPGILVKNHGPFTWGKNAHDAVHNSVVLDELSRMALQALQINPQATPTPSYVSEKHYQRKHGKNAYYGQQ